MTTLSQFSRENLLDKGRARKASYKGTTYTIGPAERSNVKTKKWRREITWDGGRRRKTVHYGYRGMQDFTQHKDEKRRKSFRARASGIRNKSGELTKDNPLSPNFYNLRSTW